jgi:hypothetical protein
VIGFRLQFAESEITKRITKTRKIESTKKCRRFMANKQRTATDQPAPIDGCGGDPYLINSKMSKIKCHRQVLVSGNPDKPGGVNHQICLELSTYYFQNNFLAVSAPSPPDKKRQTNTRELISRHKKNRDTFLTFGRCS